MLRHPPRSPLFPSTTLFRSLRPDPDEWMARLSRIPLLYQPGEAWLYDTCSDVQGVLIARVSGQPLPEFLAERLFEPLGMAGTRSEEHTSELPSQSKLLCRLL